MEDIAVAYGRDVPVIEATWVSTLKNVDHHQGPRSRQEGDHGVQGRDDDLIEGAGSSEGIDQGAYLSDPRRDREGFEVPTTTREKLQERLAKLAGGVAQSQRWRSDRDPR